MSDGVFNNDVSAPSQLALSILMPFYKNDPCDLLSILNQQVVGLPIEMIVLDDGSADPDLTHKVQSQLAEAPVTARLISCSTNLGRSAARNRLIEEACAPYLLFLDSDMAPDASTFVQDWLDLIRTGAPTVAYGGFSTQQVPDVPELVLARALAERRDCLRAEERRARGFLSVATSNLLVRADVLDAVRFDSSFSGWGWEDVEWALRVTKAGFEIQHVDIPATHMGLDRAEVILDKFAQAGRNYQTFVMLHPEVAELPAYRLTQALGSLPFKTTVSGNCAKHRAEWPSTPLACAALRHAFGEHFGLQSVLKPQTAMLLAAGG